MPTEVNITIDLRIPSEGSATCGIDVQPLGGSLFRIAEVPSVMDTAYFNYRDVVEIEITSDGVHEFRTVKKRAGWRRFDFWVSREFIGSEQLASVLARVQAAGGRWVRDFGGCLSILLPPDSIWDPSVEIANPTPNAPVPPHS